MPTPDRFVPVNVPALQGNERTYLLECISTGWISSEGPFVARFEEAVARQTGRRHAVAVSSGTAALDIATAALGLGPGDEVIVPTLTIISCVGQVVRAGATPVLVDCDPDTWNMTAERVAEKIGPRTKAILVVHLYGLPVDIRPILELAERHDIAVVEDAAEMQGQTYRGKPCGSFGDLSVLSFYANKQITTGEGGMVLTDSDSLAESCRGLRNLCFEPGRRFVHQRLGWNYRMTNLQAAVGLAQSERLEHIVRRKRELGMRYRDAFSMLNLQLPVHQTSYAENIYWVFGIVTPESGPTAEIAMQQLRERGVGCRPFFCPMHLQPVLQDLGLIRKEEYPVADSLFLRGFYIPSGLGHSDEDIEHVIDSVKQVFS